MFQENYIENYMALLACITSEEFLTANRAIRKVILENVEGNVVKSKIRNKSKTKTTNKSVKTVVIDTLRNKEYEFRTIKEAEKYFNISHGIITSYIKANRMYKKRYIFKRKEGVHNEY